MNTITTKKELHIHSMMKGLCWDVDINGVLLGWTIMLLDKLARLKNILDDNYDIKKDIFMAL